MMSTDQCLYSTCISGGFISISGYPLYPHPHRVLAADGGVGQGPGAALGALRLDNRAPVRCDPVRQLGSHDLGDRALGLAPKHFQPNGKIFRN